MVEQNPVRLANATVKIVEKMTKDTDYYKGGIYGHQHYINLMKAYGVNLLKAVCPEVIITIPGGGE